jgi:hypothetical protein
MAPPTPPPDETRWADDLSVLADVPLYRRVHPAHQYWDKNRRCWRVSTGLFKEREMSIHVGDDLTEEPQSLLTNYLDHWLIELITRDARANDQLVCRDPNEEDRTHGLVVGRKTEATMRALARSSSWTVAPEDACNRPYP